jgi:hypothetical protein
MWMFRMAKLTDFTNPISGKTQSLFDLGGLWSLVLGVVVLLVVIGTGQKAANAIDGKIPGLDSTPNRLFKDPVVVMQQTTKRVV